MGRLGPQPFGTGDGPMRLEMTGAVVLIRGVVRGARRVFQRPLPERPTPERFVEAYYLQRARSRASPEREIRRAGVGEDGNAKSRLRSAVARCVTYLGSVSNRPRLCENSNDRAPVYKFQSIFGPFPPLQARRNEKVRS